MTFSRLHIHNIVHDGRADSSAQQRFHNSFHLSEEEQNERERERERERLSNSVRNIKDGALEDNEARSKHSIKLLVRMPLSRYYDSRVDVDDT